MQDKLISEIASQNGAFGGRMISMHLNQFEKEGFVPDIVVVDPPRKGLELNIINYFQKKKIKKIVYVSCNPATLAKNINHLQKEYHQECVFQNQ